MNNNKEGVVKSTINSVLLRLGMKDKIETNLKATLADNKGTILFDDELGVGSVVFMESEGGRADLQDGEYTLEDGRKMVVKEGAVESITELSTEQPEVKEEDQAADVQMALVEKIVALTNEKADLKVEAIKEAVAAELSKIPVVTPMAAPKKEIMKLSKQEIKTMSVKERAQAFTVNLMREKGIVPKEVNLTTGNPGITSTYVGDYALPYVSAALLSGDTLANNNVTILQNVPLAGRALKVGLVEAGILGAATCDFTHNGDVTLTERKLTPVDLQIQLSVCKGELLLDWESDMMGAGRSGKSLPPGFQSWLLAQVAAESAKTIETKIWTGTAGAGSFDGYETLLTTTTSLTGGAVTTANVMTKLRIATAAIPAALKFNRDLRIYAAADIIQAYFEKQGDLGYMDAYNTGTIPLRVDGYEMVYAPGMTAGSVIIAKPSNLFFGTDLVSDHSRVGILDMEQHDLSDNVRVSMRLTAGCQVGVLADCVHGVQAA